MTRTERHYGLDWLRIAAFGLLIVYHVAMVFSPWDWVIKAPTSYPVLVAPMALLTPWRLPLLFAVSGYASRKLFEKSGSVRAFVGSRSARLGIPLGFAMLVLVPPEMWVRVRGHGYAHGLGHFWAIDAWRSGWFFGIEFPSWEHLWFVAYLWAYTLALAAMLALMGQGASDRLQRAVEHLHVGHRLVWMPIALLVVLKLAILFVIPEQKGLLNDWSSHLQYMPIFTFGFALGGSRLLWPAIRRARWWAAAIAVVTGIIVTVVELLYQAHDMPPHIVMAIDRAARLAMAWGMILVLLHIAQRYWNRDHRWRAPLGEAVFPFYIVHHPALILLAWYTLPLGLDARLEFVVLLGGTAAACVTFYAIGREIGWVRPLIGLRARPRHPARTRDPGFRAA